MHQLTNGRYKVVITPAGGGQSSWDWMALSRWADDPVEDARGFFLYVRDLDSKKVWSAGLLPVCWLLINSSFPVPASNLNALTEPLGLFSFTA